MRCCECPGGVARVVEVRELGYADIKPDGGLC
jgi:hypothetical protein